MKDFPNLKAENFLKAMEVIMVIKNNPYANSAEKTKSPQANWPDFAIGLYDKLTGRGAQITYEFDNLEIGIPNRTGENAEHFHWKLSGTMNIRTQDEVNSSEHEQN